MWRLTCLLGRLRSAASVQQVICRSGSTCRCIFDAFVGRKFSSVIQSCPALWDTMDCSTPSFPVHHQLQEFAQTHGHRVGDAIQPSHPLSSPPPPAFNLAQHQGLESVLHISFSISPSSEHSGLTSFRTDWLDLLAVQGTLKSLLQHHSSKASILRNSAFFMVQLSQPYMTTEKNHSFN